MSGTVLVPETSSAGTGGSGGIENASSPSASAAAALAWLFRWNSEPHGDGLESLDPSKHLEIYARGICKNGPKQTRNHIITQDCLITTQQRFSLV